MTELAVVSGKGGTGKTSLVGSFAVLAKNKVMVDCDVDAADLHLIMRHEVRESAVFIAGAQASINEEKCIACGICEEYCRFGAVRYELDEKSNGLERFWIDRLACDGCGVCSHFCPEQAIDFKETVSGLWFLSDTRHGPLLHARLGIAQSNSGKLVALLRRKAKFLAAERKLDLIIVDGPPGVGCPVIASITGATYLVAVTEPSLSALHDLERLLDLTRHFRIPAGVCINKYDINLRLTERIERLAESREISLLGRIAYDPAVTKAQVAGTTLVEYTDDGASEEVRTVWTNLKNELGAAECAKMEMEA
jgi:MinD superfamily P-loop ATPase